MNARWCSNSVMVGVALLFVSGLDGRAVAQPVSGASSPVAARRAILDQYCVGCHNQRTQSGKLRLDNMDAAAVGAHGEVWERVVKKLRGGVMPPPGAPRPTKADTEAFVSGLEAELDAVAMRTPHPGRTESLHRLNRTEYRNAVRDVLALDMDFVDLLPGDVSGGGEASFDNIAASLRLTQTLMEQYLSVAAKVARLAVGGEPPLAELRWKVKEELRQDVQLEGMPFGTRGGILINHIVPVNGEYGLRIRIVGRGAGQVEVAVDGERVQLFAFRSRQRQETGYQIEGQEDVLEARLPLAAGPREITVAFVKTDASFKIEHDRMPFFGGRGGGRLAGSFVVDLMSENIPGIDEVILTGPLTVSGSGDTPSRRRIFSCRPVGASQEEPCARTILAGLARRAYRRPVAERDMAMLMRMFQQGRAGRDFDAGVERAIRAMLANPNFLLRVSAEPAAVPPGAAYKVSDLELASRLSFFIWSSVPDERLLNLAVKGALHQPAILEQQVRRMLKDPRADSLTTSFAAQWLWLRNLTAALPAQTMFPNFDEGLRQAFEKEVSLFFRSIIREDRSVIDLIDADYTFLNERLAKHYGVSGVYGMDFRRVSLPAGSPRRGLLGKGMLLLVTSRSTRTSPVIRGKWILENLLGTPPPAPPANVPPLPEQKQNDGRVLTVRELMARHRANPVCASCHSTIDPAGFALEQFDAVGQWRTTDSGFQAIDASGALPDGTKFGDINGFRALLLERREQFVRTFTNKLTMYALGRGTEYYDAPAIRRIVREAATGNYRVSDIVIGIVKSVPFQMRTAAR